MAATFLRTVKAWLLDRLYNECAPLYDTVAMRISRGHWFLWGQAVIPYLQPPILELGCGTGHLLATIARQHIPAWGLDRSARMLRRARRRTMSLIHGDSRAIPCPDATFARVVAVFPASYISDPRTLAEVRRVLQADGRLVILLSAGKHTVRMHPLWDALTNAGWQLETPDCTVVGTTIHLIIGTPHVTDV